MRTKEEITENIEGNQSRIDFLREANDITVSNLYDLEKEPQREMFERSAIILALRWVLNKGENE